ncbi:hypothetical protein HMPREF0262_01617 [Clostridium sp. ATCC 29733]|nr:hypothetical protein HMPREF0262_01617 [Clostridium sp. ATCC 29733]
MSTAGPSLSFFCPYFTRFGALLQREVPLFSVHPPCKYFDIKV